jgi:hypothetical protein
MPRGPRGEKRPADVIGNAVKVMRIATGEEADDADDSKSHHREGGAKGGMARASALTADRRSEIARRGAQARWRKP